MEKNIELLNGQFALVRIQYKTGIVLDENLNISLAENKNIYSVFESYNDAKNSAFEIVKNNAEIECVIYHGEKMEVAEIINIDSI